MYLGFHLDPLYNVHWNNLVDPVQYEFLAPEGVTISPSKGKGPDVAQESDSDPREFLLDVTRGGSTEPAHLTFRYFACDEKMCMPVTQEYAVHWTADPDGGNPNRNRFGAGGRGRFSLMTRSAGTATPRFTRKLRADSRTR